MGFVPEDQNEDESLMVLDMMLKAKNGPTEDDLEHTFSDDGSDNSANSVRIITQSAGTVHEIRELYSTKCAENPKGGKQALHQIAPEPANRESASVDDNNHGKNVNSVKEQAGSSVNQSADQSDTNKGLNESKKRKISDNSDPSISPTGVNANNLYPVFRKVSETKEPKELRDNANKTVKNNKSEKVQSKKKKYKKGRDNLEEDESRHELNEESDPISLLHMSEESMATVDIRTMVDFFTRIKTCVKDLDQQYRTQMSELKIKTKSTINEKVEKTKQLIERDIQTALTDYEEKLKSMEEKLAKQKQKSDLMADLLQQSYQVQVDLSKRIDTHDLAYARRSAILTGLDFANQKKERLGQIKAFFMDTLGLSVEIEDTYFLGENNPRPVVIIFPSTTEKQLIWDQKSQLRHYCGVGNRSIFLNDYMPPCSNDRKKRERDIINELKASGDKQQKHEFTAEGLKIAGATYKKQVIEPSPTDLLDLDTKELDETLAFPTNKGDRIVVEGNVFTAYCIDAKTHQDVRTAYLKVRLLNARARHIICAYTLPNSPKHLNYDYADDGETGAGRALLAVMQNNSITHKAIYVARFCGPTKLGGKRFDSYIRAAQEVIRKYPINKLLRKRQDIVDTKPVYPKARLSTEKKSAEDPDARPERFHYAPRNMSVTKKKTIQNNNP